MKTFKEFLNETIIYVDDVEVVFTSHFIERMQKRSISKEDFKTFLSKIRQHLKELPMKGEFLFYSQSLKQGVVTAWSALNKQLRLITLLPKERANPASGTEKVIIESSEFTIIQKDSPS